MATGTRYAGKVVVVTGGARGIGAGIVRAFGERGLKKDGGGSGGRALERELPGAVFILCDVTQEDDKMKKSNNISFLLRPWFLRPSADLAAWIVCETLGTFPTLALPHLRKSQGNIINISSLVGAIGQAQAVAYVASKGAVTAMTKALALDESPYGVRVNCISPGNIWTPLWEELAASTPDPRATILEGTLAQPLGRMGQPAEVGAAAVFLASEANFCTGIELFVTGGAELGYGRKARRSTPVDVPDIPS
uniref:Hydroxysteroid 17-beta dehydrogenase 14 n=1 Tax=Cebus imitator TaxID=2715852 RepID=A0A2K5RA21_CEBIM